MTMASSIDVLAGAATGLNLRDAGFVSSVPGVEKGTASAGSAFKGQLVGNGAGGLHSAWKAMLESSIGLLEGMPDATAEANESADTLLPTATKALSLRLFLSEAVAGLPGEASSVGAKVVEGKGDGLTSALPAIRVSNAPAASAARQPAGPEQLMTYPSAGTPRHSAFAQRATKPVKEQSKAREGAQEQIRVNTGSTIGSAVSDLASASMPRVPQEAPPPNGFSGLSSTLLIEAPAKMPVADKEPHTPVSEVAGSGAGSAAQLRSPAASKANRNEIAGNIAGPGPELRILNGENMSSVQIVQTAEGANQIEHSDPISAVQEVSNRPRPANQVSPGASALETGSVDSSGNGPDAKVSVALTATAGRTGEIVIPTQAGVRSGWTGGERTKTTKSRSQQALPQLQMRSTGGERTMAAESGGGKVFSAALPIPGPTARALPMPAISFQGKKEYSLHAAIRPIEQHPLEDTDALPRLTESIQPKVAVLAEKAPQAVGVPVGKGMTSSPASANSGPVRGSGLASGQESTRPGSRDPQGGAALSDLPPQPALKPEPEKNELAQGLSHAAHISHEHTAVELAGTAPSSQGEGAGQMRYSSGEQRVAGLPHAQAGESGGTRGGPNAQETLTALDTDAGPRASWVHADARSAEAGFSDPALGWVGVRANAGTGGVHASVVPGSAGAAEALGGHMAGLNDYLSRGPNSVATVTLAAPRGAEPYGSTDAGQQGMGSSHGQGTNQGSPQDSHSSANQPSLTLNANVARAVSEAGSVFERVEASRGVSGGHISIMA